MIRDWKVRESPPESSSPGQTPRQRWRTLWSRRSRPRRPCTGGARRFRHRSGEWPDRSPGWTWSRTFHSHHCLHGLLSHGMMWWSTFCLLSIWSWSSTVAIYEYDTNSKCVENRCDFIKDQKFDRRSDTWRFSNCSINEVKADHADIRGALDQKHFQWFSIHNIRQWYLW